MDLVFLTFVTLVAHINHAIIFCYANIQFRRILIEEEPKWNLAIPIIIEIANLGIFVSIYYFAFT